MDATQGKKLFLSHKGIFYTFLPLSFVCILLLPFILPGGLFEGHDLLYHIARIKALAYQIEHGMPFVKINPWFLDGAGYASSMAYPDVFLYIPAVMMHAGVSEMDAYNAFVIICIGALMYTSYIALYVFTNNKEAALFGAFIYSISIYHIDVLMERAALGEIQSFIFIPLLISGLYDVICRESKKPHYISVAFTGFILSHVISSILSIVFSIAFFIIHIRHITKAKFIILCKHLLLAAGITMYFWLPLLEFYISNDIAIKHAKSPLQNTAVEFSALFLPSKLIPGNAEFGLTVYLFVLYVMYRFSAANKRANIFFATGASLALAATNLFPWNSLSALSIIQFPWRLYSFALFFIAIALSIYATRLFHEKRYVLLVHIAVFLSCYSTFHVMHFTTKSKFTPGSVTSFEIGYGREYLPHAYVQAQAPREVQVKSNDASVVMERTVTGRKIHVNHRVYIEKLPTDLICYTGYRAIAHDTGQDTFSPPVLSEKGTCVISMERDFSGSVEISYHASYIQKISYMLSAICLVYAFFLGLKQMFCTTYCGQKNNRF